MSENIGVLYSILLRCQLFKQINNKKILVSVPLCNFMYVWMDFEITLHHMKKVCCKRETQVENAKGQGHHYMKTDLLLLLLRICCRRFIT